MQQINKKTQPLDIWNMCQNRKNLRIWLTSFEFKSYMDRPFLVNECELDWVRLGSSNMGYVLGKWPILYSYCLDTGWRDFCYSVFAASVRRQKTVKLKVRTDWPIYSQIFVVHKCEVITGWLQTTLWETGSWKWCGKGVS